MLRLIEPIVDNRHYRNFALSIRPFLKGVACQVASVSDAASLACPVKPHILKLRFFLSCSFH